MEKNKCDLIDLFLYELIDRISRLLTYIDEVELEYFSKIDNDSQKAIINSYKESLYQLLKLVISIYKDKEIISENDIIKQFTDCLFCINELHEKYLRHLPRPKEPVELTRFRRVIDKQIIILDKRKDVQLLTTDELGESVFDKDPLNKFITERLIPLIKGYNVSSSKTFSFKEYESQERNSHIFIPRVDAATNPTRWPTLLHEMSHLLMDNQIFIQNDIFIDFSSGLSPSALDRVRNIQSEQKINIKSWLSECWCDLMACILIGPSFYFSQYLAFVVGFDKNNHQSHPCSVFRLQLIENIIKHRFRNTHEQLVDFMDLCEKLIIEINQDYCSSQIETSSYLYQLFQNYFINHFFKSENNQIALKNEVLNEKLKKISKKYTIVQEDILTSMVKELEEGLPIPSIAIEDNSFYRELPATVQEIFLAGWVNRLKKLKIDIIGVIDNYNKKTDITSFYSEEIKKRINRADQALLRSIQVSEWFDFYNDELRPNKISIFNKRKNKEIESTGILVDKEIKSLIFNKELKIIPIMNLDKQLGTTSFDVRLGTSFELFYSNQSGIVDFTRKNTVGQIQDYSQKVNLDFKDSITINPNQFVLGHSMEYVKLPDYICADLEGRSSFARLGIEIHMTAGFIDPGFEGVITFEIHNNGPLPVKLYPGLRIGQLRFSSNSLPENPYAKRHSVKYRGLLEHHNSMQFKDYEIDILRENLKNS
jgi:dCTP deaminase